MTDVVSGENESAQNTHLLVCSTLPSHLTPPHHARHNPSLPLTHSPSDSGSLSLWSNFNSDWLGEASDIAPLLTWILMHADSHIHTHEQLILHHTAQAQHWHKLKRASQRHIAQHTTPAAATPLSPLSANLMLSPLAASSPSLKRGKPLTDSQLRNRFNSVHKAHKAQEAGAKGKENMGAGVELEAVVRRVKAVVGGSGVKGEGGSASKGVKFAEQATVIGQGHVPVNDKATKKQLLKEKDRQQQPTADEVSQVLEAVSALPPNAVEETAPEPAVTEYAKVEEETKEQLPETDVESQSAIVTPTRKQPETIDTRSPELLLPSLSTLLQSVAEGDDSTTVSLHITTTATATAMSPSSSPLPPPPPPPSPAVAQSPPPSRLSPFLQFHPSLKEHPYHQTLAAYQSLPPTASPASVAGMPPIPASAPSLPPRKRADAPPALNGGVVRFRVDSDADAPLSFTVAAPTAPVSSSSAPLSPAPTTPHSASLASPPPLPPRRPALPTSAPRTASAAASASSSSSAAMVGVGSGAFRYVIPGQLPVAGSVQPKHRRQRSKSVDLTGSRRIQ